MTENSLGIFLPEMRLDFWDALWQGQITSVKALEKKLSVLKLPISIHSTCYRCTLTLQHGDDYLEQIWRYGQQRLRVAVGNLLPKEDSGVVYGVCQLTTRHIHILACAAHSQTAPALKARLEKDIAALVEALEQYLDLFTTLKEMIPVESLVDLVPKT